MCHRMIATVLHSSAISIRNAIIPILLLLQAVLMPTPVNANDYLQCVPFARELSGVQIYGDARSWWDQADGVYQRGTQPAVESDTNLVRPDRKAWNHRLSRQRLYLSNAPGAKS